MTYPGFLRATSNTLIKVLFALNINNKKPAKYSWKIILLREQCICMEKFYLLGTSVQLLTIYSVAELH